MRAVLFGVICGTLLIGVDANAQNGRRFIGQATVIDGDTIQVGTERIRLWGIDAFEPAQKCGSLNCGATATDFLKTTIKNAFDSNYKDVFCIEKDKDRYGRIVAICRLGAIDLGAAMVVSGNAVAYRKYSLDYVAEEEQAKATMAGAWSTQFQTPEDYRRPQETESALLGSPAQSAPAQPVVIAPIAPIAVGIMRQTTINNYPTQILSSGCQIKGNVNSNGEKIYHMPGSTNYSRTIAEEMFCSEEAAIYAGFRAPRSSVQQRTVAAFAAPMQQSGNISFPNCAAVRDAGRAPIYAGQPGYSRRLDRDGDGVACER